MNSPTGLLGGNEPLLALVLADQRRRWRGGERVLVEAYLEEQASLNAEAVQDLIYNEVLLRREVGEAPHLEEYLARFPGLNLALRLLFAMDEQLATAGDAPPPGTPPEPPAAPAIPGYEVLGELGRGGMGVVYKARQLSLNRLVAVKKVRADLAGPQERRRFQSEAEAVARLQHPNIVQIFEVGEHQGQPFLCLELVEGGSLAERLKGVPLPARVAAGLVEALARAVEYAHGQGVVHRDLKPANVLLSGAARPQAAEEVVPKITDFGLAKRLDVPGHTESRAILGTPGYMAPEQASGQSACAGASCDVWSLGAILYECLTGRAPFVAESPLATLLQVCNDEPVPPSRLRRNVPRDLDVICLKCLQKRPSRRYLAAVALADDLGRFLQGLPIHARPVGPAEHAWRWCRRNPLAAGLLLALLAVFSGGLAGVTWKWREALALAGEKEGLLLSERDQKVLTEQALQEARANLDSHRTTLAHREWMANNPGETEALLDACSLAHQKEWEWRYLNRLRRGHLLAFRAESSRLRQVGFSPDGKRIVSSDYWMRAVTIHDASTGSGLHPLRGKGGWLARVACNQERTRLARPGEASREVDVVVTFDRGKTLLWDALTGQHLLTFPGPPPEDCVVACSRDARRLATVSPNGPLQVWDATTGQRGITLPFFRPRWPTRTTFPPAQWADQVAFSPDGESLAATADGVVCLWKPTQAEPLATFPASAGISHLAFSPDGRRLATANGGKPIIVWDVATRRPICFLRGQVNAVWCLAFSPDGTRLAAGSTDQTVRVWRLSAGPSLAQPDITIRGHTSGVVRLAFHPGGQRLVSVDEGGMAKVWDLTIDQQVITLVGHRGSVVALAFQPDGRRLVSTSSDGRVRLWDLAGRREVPFLGETGPQRRGAVAYSPDGRCLAVPGAGAVVLHDAATGREMLRLTGHIGLVTSLAFCPGRPYLAAVSIDPISLGHMAHVWDLTTGQPAAFLLPSSKGVHAVAFSPDGLFALAEADKSVTIRDVADGREVRRLRGHAQPVDCLAFGRDGSLLATGSGDNTVRLWDAGRGVELFQLRGHRKGIMSVAFTPDGRRLASASADQTVRLWDTTSGREALTLRGHGLFVTAVAFSPDGEYLASASSDSTVKLWHAPRWAGQR